MPIFPLFVEEIVGEAERAASETGLLLAITGVAGAVAAAMAGRLSDRFGHKKMLVLATALTGVMAIPHAAAHSMWELALLRVLFGIGAGGMIPAMNALVAGTVPRENIGQAYGFTTTASALGWAVGPVLGGWAASAFGYRIPFVMTGVMLLLVALVQQRGLRPATASSHREVRT
jgi:DHA1 family multidrug resistance protein-like MFS transporter